MTSFDLGVWSGVILAAVPGLKVYQAYGVLAGIGAYLASIIVLGLLGGFLMMFVIDTISNRGDGGDGK